MSSVMAAPARILVEFCGRQRIDTAEMLAAAGVDPNVLSDPAGRLTAEACHRLWLHAWGRLEDPALAVHVAESAPLGSFQLMHFLCAHSATPGGAFEQLCAHARAADSRLAFSLRSEGGRIAVCLAAEDIGDRYPRVQAEFCLAMTYLGVARSTGLNFVPQRVELMGAPPADPGEWQRVFSCPVEFARPEYRMWFGAETWDLPVPRANPDLLRILDAHGRQILEQIPCEPSVASRVRQVIEARLESGAPAVGAVARALGLSTRGLQRLLHEAGTSFSAEVESVRLSLARRLLADRKRSIADIAFALGFSEQSAFTRAYRRWTGMPPRQERRAAVDESLGHCSAAPLRPLN